MAPVRSMRTLYPRIRGADLPPRDRDVYVVPLPPRTRG